MIDKRKTAFARKLRTKQTDVEKLLWFYLRGRQLMGIKFRRQQTIGSYIVDFIALENKLIIELDGGQHNDDNTVKRDQIRTKWLEDEGFTVLRFWNNEINSNLDGVLEVIQKALTLTLSPDERGDSS